MFLGVIGVFVLLSPFSLHAGVIATFADKFKTIFISSKEKEDDQKVFATTQTMDLFKPTVVDGTTTEGAGVPLTQDQESLQAVSGALRVSTEDVDFPVSDTISVYEVKKGDTIEEVARLFSVSVNTIMWANNLTSRSIAKGDTLIILPITGIKHTVRKGDTMLSVAKRYKADVADMATYNGIDVDAKLAVGDVVIVPDGEIEIIPSSTKTTKSTKTKKSKILDVYTQSTPSGFLTRPVNGGIRTQGIHGHNGIDIAATPGTPIFAAAQGKVIVAKASGYNGGYGGLIIITHEKGIQTVYAHLRAVYVTSGQTVAQGEQIGELGNTGRSTGPHLHFEVRGAKNPF